MTCVNSVSIGTYNCRGFNADRQRYVKTLLSKLSILFIQEHWLSDSQLTLLGTLSQDFFYLPVCLVLETAMFCLADLMAAVPFCGALIWVPT